MDRTRPMEASILIVEPDERDARLVERALLTQSATKIIAEDYEEAVKTITRERPDLVLSEMDLDNKSGLELCSWVRATFGVSDTPFVFLSHSGGEMDRIAGFEAGATDYVTKPFSARELDHRVQAILRRSGVGKHRRLSSRVVPRGSRGRYLVNLNGQELSLLHYEYRILLAMLDSGGRVMTRKELVDTVWGPGTAISERTVDAHVKGLRRSLGDDRGLLETVYRIGYRLRADMVE